MEYLHEFIGLALVHLIAVASPGPDFAIVVRNSVAYGRRIAMITSIGIGLAILLHVTYSLLGLSMVIATTPWLFQVFSYAAAGYLLYLAWGALRSPKPAIEQQGEQAEEVSTSGTISGKKALWDGFLTNGLNPKATLFFMSLFTAFIDINTPTSIKLGYGIYLAFATGAWFCFLSYLLSTSKVASFIGNKGYLLDRLMGGLLVLLAVKLVVG